MNEIKVDGKKTSYPENWAEIDNRKKLLEIAQILSEKDLSGAEKKLSCLKKLAPIGKIMKAVPRDQYDWEMLVDLQKLDPDAPTAHLTNYNIAIHQMTETIDFMLSPEGFYRDILEFFEFGKTWHYGPGDYFQYVSYDEFAHCDEFASEYLETGDQFFLDCLVATLYRPSRATGKKKIVGKKIKGNGEDRREMFSSNKIEHQAKAWANLPKKIKFLALYYFLGCKQALIQEDENAKFSAFDHSQPESGSKEEGETEQEGGQWESIAWGIAETDAFSSIEEVEQKNIRKIIEFLQRQKMKLEDLKKEQKDNS